MFQSCSNSWFKSTALHNSTALHSSMTSGYIKKTMTKRTTKPTRKKAGQQANVGARVQAHIGRSRARLPKDFGAYIEIAHQEMYLNAAGGAVVLRMVRHLERMGMHLVDDPMDVDSEGERR